MPIELHDVGALLETEKDVELGAAVTAQRDRFDDVVGNAGANLVVVEDDAIGERLLANDRLPGPGHRDEVG
jgi:hypothetical protein